MILAKLKKWNEEYLLTPNLYIYIFNITYRLMNKSSKTYLIPTSYKEYYNDQSKLS
jgi:hypothetical protein